MKILSIVFIGALAIAPLATMAGPRGGGGGGGGAARGGGGAARGGGGASRSTSTQGRGFNMSNDVPSQAARGSNGAAGYNKNTGNAAAYNKNTGTATTYNKSTNTATQYHKNTSNSGTYNNTYNRIGSGYNGYNGAAYNGKNGAAVYNKNTGNMRVYNKNTGTTSAYHYNANGRNAYYYGGRVVVNPRYYGPAWGWNRGVVWAPVGAYWGGGFWGPFAVGAATAAVMGSIVYANQTYTSYSVNTGSPGATLLSNYGLRQVPCGSPGLVVIYGPNFGIICANPNNLVAAGNYAVNVDNLTLQSQ